MPDSARFHELANQQIDAEFWGAHQYVATAAWFESVNMAATAKVFWDHAAEERKHAERFVRYLLERNLTVTVGPVAPVVNKFATPLDALVNAVERERDITARIFALADVARAERDWFAEQFIAWFIAEQREEEELFTTLLAVAEKPASTLEFEQYVTSRT